MEQILREQIVELMKLLELKDMRIKELEALRTIPQIYQGPFIAPFIAPVITCDTQVSSGTLTLSNNVGEK